MLMISIVHNSRFLNISHSTMSIQDKEMYQEIHESNQFHSCSEYEIQLEIDRNQHIVPMPKYNANDHKSRRFLNK
jgi:hypothetical protein